VGVEHRDDGDGDVENVLHQAGDAVEGIVVRSVDGIEPVERFETLCFLDFGLRRGMRAHGLFEGQESLR